MGSLVPISKTPLDWISQDELKEYIELRRAFTETRVALRLMREEIAKKLRRGADIEDGVLVVALYRRRGKRDRLLVGC